MSSPVNSAKGRPAFSLVEVAIAMGILAFAIMGLIGLLVIGFSTAKESEGDVRTVLIANRVFNLVKAELYTSAAFQNPPAPWQSSVRDYWFDDRGVEAPNQALSFFQARVTVAPLAQYPINTDDKILKSVSMELSWPSGTTSSVRKVNFTRLIRNAANYN